MSKETNSINYEALAGSMHDYVAELVKRNQLRLEVAESISLKHQLLIEAESYQALKNNLELRQEISSRESENKKVHSQIEVLQEEIQRLSEELKKSQQSLISSEDKHIAELRDFKGKLASAEALLEENVELLKKSYDEKYELTKESEGSQKKYIEKISQLKEACKEQQDSIVRLKDQLERKKSDIELIRKENTQLEKECAALQSNKKRLLVLEQLLAQQKEQLNDYRSKMAALKNAAEFSTKMSKEVFDFADKLQREYLHTSHELGQTTARAVRIKNHLSYRLGSVLVSNSGSLLGLLKIPGRLREEHKSFQRYRLEQAASEEAIKKEIVQKLVLGDNYSSARTRWRILEISCDSAFLELNFSVLTPQSEKAISCELMLIDGYGAEIVMPDGSKKAAGQIIGIGLVSTQSNFKLSVAAPGFCRIAMRKTAGGAAIAKIQVARSSKSYLAPTDLTNIVRAPTNLELGNASSVDVKPMKSAIIWQAHQMMQEGRATAAIEFANKHARDFIKPAINLLIANANIEKEDVWLNSVNSYLRQFSISPISLNPGSESRFLRLKCENQSRYENGPLISVIMPTFNAEKTISHALGSILNQSWRNLEVIVVDDASEDGTWDIVKTLANYDPRVKIFRNARNVGPYVSKNMGLQFCTGDFITGHDSDDWAHPDRLAHQVTELIESKGYLKGNIARMIRMGPDGSFVHFAKEGKTSDDGVLRDAAISCMFERDFFIKTLGHWDCVRFGADSELISRAQKIMQDRFKKSRLMSMICLDNEGSLTNDPVHGVSKTTGISPTRKFYRDQWTEWHKVMQPQHAYLAFPHTNRVFAVPDAAAVPNSDIEENLNLVRLALNK
ncbi:glycosyltransferase [Bordetella trematum]|uniref:glycosyltransferase n=1 Tax=Bordetella trematum TaxID=123899 RepID=UPI0039894011